MSEDRRPWDESSFRGEAPGFPLAGIRVLDFTHVLAGPFCTRLLADLGAEVLHVESRTRPGQMGPPAPDSAFQQPQFRGIFSFNTDRNKRSISINLKTDAGRNLAARLAGAADVLVENFSSGVMARLGLDDERLRSLNRRLIYVSMSGYGHNGPRSDWTSMNMNLQGYSGMTMVTGAEDDPPVGISNSWNDYIGGLHACFGILQALRERAATQAGARLDLSQFECSVATLGSLLLASIVNRVPPPRSGNRSPNAAPQGVYRCRGVDEWCVITVESDLQWRALAGAMGDPDLVCDSRFGTLEGRLRHQDLLDLRIEAWTVELSHIEVETRLKSAGVPAERMRRIHDVLSARDGTGIFRPLKDASGAPRLVTGAPFDFSVSSLSPLRRAPELGEHTGDALHDWLGLTEDEIRALEAGGVLD